MANMIYKLTMKDGSEAAYHADAFHSWVRNQGNHVATDFRGRLNQLRSWLDCSAIVDWEMDS